MVMNKDVNNGQSRREFLGKIGRCFGGCVFPFRVLSLVRGRVWRLPLRLIRRRRQARLTRSSVACKSARSLIVGVPCRVDWRISSSIAKKRISVPLSWWEVIWKLMHQNRQRRILYCICSTNISSKSTIGYGRCKSERSFAPHTGSWIGNLFLRSNFILLQQQNSRSTKKRRIYFTRQQQFKIHVRRFRKISTTKKQV